jgi:hypothetical protein
MLYSYRANPWDRVRYGSLNASLTCSELPPEGGDLNDFTNITAPVRPVTASNAEAEMSSDAGVRQSFLCMCRLLGRFHVSFCSIVVCVVLSGLLMDLPLSQ